MSINIDACRENAEALHQARLDDAADRAEHYDTRAFRQLHDEFLTAALSSPAALLYLPGQSRPEPVGDLIAQEVVDDVANECIRILAALARGATEGLQARAAAWFDGLADQHADRYCGELSARLEEDDEAEADDARIDAFIDSRMAA